MAEAFDSLLTSTEAAELLGVGPTSVKRWADDGRLPSIKTPGKHRRFERHAVERFLAKSRLDTCESKAAEWVSLFLTEHREHSLQAALLQRRAELGSWWKVANELGESLVLLGVGWKEGRVGIVQEHLASERFSRALNMVSHSLPLARKAPRALLVSADGDDHTLGLSLTELCLRELGLETLWIGRNTPTDVLVEHLKHHVFEVVAVSASLSSKKTKLQEQLPTIESACAPKGKLLLGGLGPWPLSTSGIRIKSFQELQLALAS